MKALLNMTTGMIALVANEGVMNKKKGDVFGVKPRDAGRLVKGGHAKLLEDVRKKVSDKIKFEEVDIDTDTGIVTDADGNVFTDTGRDPKTGKAVPRKVGADAATADAQKDEVSSDQKPSALPKPGGEKAPEGAKDK